MGEISATITSDDLKRLVQILKREADGKTLRRQLAADLRKASEPVRDAARAAILSMSSGGLAHEGEPLRQAIASKIITEARLTGRSTGAKVKARRKGMPRGFVNAPKRTNRDTWRHPVFKRVTSKGTVVDVWVDQTGKPRWFDDEMTKHRASWRVAVVGAMNATAERIARGVH